MAAKDKKVRKPADPAKVPMLLRGDRRRAFLALLSCTAVALLVGAAVGAYMLGTPSETTPERAASTFRLFTVLSNMLSAMGCFLSIPFAVEGIRKDRYHIPEWCITILYAGATSVAVTFLFSVLLIAPIMGTQLAFGGSNFYMHLMCPILCVCAFLFLESEHKMGVIHTIIALLPFLAYATVYFIQVVVIGEANGGWRDIYKLNTFVPFWVSLPIMLAMGYGVARGLAAAHNVISRRQAAWDEQHAISFSERVEGDSLDAEIEKMAKKHAEKEPFGSYMIIPIRALETLNQKYDNEHTLENMCRLYLDFYLAAKLEDRGGVPAESVKDL